MSDKKHIEDGKCALVFCEGVDEKTFFLALIKAHRDQYPKLENIQLVDFGGITELTRALQTWQALEGIEHIRSIGVIRDAESNAAGAIQSIQHSLSAAKLPVPKNCFQLEHDATYRVAFAILPGMTDDSGRYADGTLEDLCVTILADTTKLPSDVADFLDDMEIQHGIRYKRKHKNRLHSYFGATNEYVGLKIGEASNKHAFDMHHVKLAKYVKMLCALTDDEK